jgi:hypothetical protein
MKPRFNGRPIFPGRKQAIGDILLILKGLPDPSEI